MNAVFRLQIILISFSLLILNGCSDGNAVVHSLVGEWRMTFNQDVDCNDSMNNYLLEEFSPTPCIGGEEECVYVKFDFGEDNGMLDFFANYAESGENLEALSESATYSIEGDSVIICTIIESEVMGLPENECLAAAYTISSDGTIMTMNFLNLALEGCRKTLELERL